MNCVQITGRLVKDVKTVAGEKEGCVFTIACQRDKDHADFFPCSAWNAPARFLDEYSHKGDLVGITGRLTSYKDKEENTKYGIVVDKVEILSYAKREDK